MSHKYEHVSTGNGFWVASPDGSSRVQVVSQTGQFKRNVTSSSAPTLKLHNHLTTSDIANEFKGELVNTTGTVVGSGNYWSYQPTGGAGTPDGVSANNNAMAIAGSMTLTTGAITGVTGEVQLQGTLNGAAVSVAGLSGVLSGAGANTLVGTMAGVASYMGTGLINPTTGTLSHFQGASAGTVVIDNVINLLGSEYITNFASFNSAATDKCIEASVAEPAGNTTHALRILIAGVEGYIPVYAAKTF